MLAAPLRSQSKRPRRIRQVKMCGGVYVAGASPSARHEVHVQDLAQQYSDEHRAAPAYDALHPLSSVAASWHTTILLVFMPFWAYRGIIRAEHLQSATDVSRVSFYLQTISAQWLIFAFVLLGVWLHKSPLSLVLGERWRSAAAFFRDIGVALLFWLSSALALGALAILLRARPSAHAMGFLLPDNNFEIALWIAVSVTAGICEETVFRGYLQRQFLAWTNRAPVAIALSALLFGALHAYQGWRGAIGIGLLGAMLGTMAHLRGTVRTGMIAHAWQDTVAGILGGLVKH
jgi:membrane protease YdiL (CAAX protease family)